MDQAATWREAATTVVHDVAPDHADDLLDSIAFTEVLEALADVDPADDQFDEAVEAAVEAFLLDGDDVQESWDETAHPRAASGAAGGGQFVAGGGGAAAAAPASSSTSGGKKASGKRRIKGETLSYDPKTKRGVGYGRKGGDPRVRKLQAALNRLGLKDAKGRKLVLDGKLGPLTTQAIKAAQKQLGLKPDGKVTPDLLVKLVAAKTLKKAPAKPAKATPAKAAPAKATRKKEADGDDDEDEPYGDVEYADPGYQEDGVKRYPLDTEEHCRAAWSYINQADNAAKYTAEQLEQIKTRIKAALEEYGAEVAEDANEAIQDRIDGRVLEAKGTAGDGGRVFRVRIITAGDSRNGRRYPAQVLRESAHLYEGAKAYDHHRTLDELRSSTINGLVGYYRNVEATGDGLDGDLCLLPGARHTAEALDATLVAQAAGLPPLVGISHDAMTVLRPINHGGRRLQEAVAITRVNSADVVADPAAGGKATRVLAGGIETDPSTDGQSNQEEDVTVTSDAVLAALQTATPEQLAAVGLSRASAETAGEPAQPVEGTETTEAVGALTKGSFLGGLMIERKVEAAGLPTAVATQLAASLPDRITESDVDNQIAALKSILGVAERAGLAPTVTTQVTQESMDKKTKALDAFFAQDWTNGYHSFRQAWQDITGYRPRDWSEDVSRRILRESFGPGFDSGLRSTESADTTTWAQVLGDSVTRRMQAMYNTPSLQTWRQIVSSITPVPDFRTQRVGRIGGYGTLPTVNEGAPYQPLTTPGDEEATGALSKKGGTEDVTLEMIANDDRRAISKIPDKLGRAAAQTLYRDVFDVLADNDTCTFDSTALFHTNHANTDTSAALAQSTLSTGRRKMIEQAAYGDSSEILALTPKFVVVPPELEEISYQLSRSAVAIPSSIGASDQPNIHQGITPILVPYYTDANDWFLVADPNDVPTLEVGFYNGRQTPELFTQSDASVGSVFNADVFTWKIRFIYYVMILDYRGFYRGQG